MKNYLCPAVVVMFVGWGCAGKSTVTEIASTPSPVLSSYVVNGNSKATVAWETPSENPPQQYVRYIDTVALFSFSRATRIRTVPTHPAGGVVVTPDSRFAYVSSSLSGEVRVVDLAQLKLVDSIKVGLRPLILDMTPDGNHV